MTAAKLTRKASDASTSAHLTGVLGLRWCDLSNELIRRSRLVVSVGWCDQKLRYKPCKPAPILVE
jgi:hypothetical protein